MDLKADLGSPILFYIIIAVWNEGQYTAYFTLSLFFAMSLQYFI